MNDDMGTINPFFYHDCDGCDFLGQARDGKKKYDLYVHWDSDERTVIARYGSEPHEYLSGIAGALLDTRLKAALDLAIAEGIIFEQIRIPAVVRMFLGDKVALRFPKRIERISKAYQRQEMNTTTAKRVKDEVTKVFKDLWGDIPEKQRPSFDKCPRFAVIITDKNSLAVEFNNMSLSSETFFEPVGESEVGQQAQV